MAGMIYKNGVWVSTADWNNVTLCLGPGTWDLGLELEEH